MDNFVIYTGIGGMVDFDMAMNGLYLKQSYVHTYIPRFGKYRYVFSFNTKNGINKAYVDINNKRIDIKQGTHLLSTILAKPVQTDTTIYHEEYGRLDMKVVERLMKPDEPYGTKTSNVKAHDFVSTNEHDFYRMITPTIFSLVPRYANDKYCVGFGVVEVINDRDYIRLNQVVTNGVHRLHVQRSYVYKVKRDGVADLCIKVLSFITNDAAKYINHEELVAENWYIEEYEADIKYNKVFSKGIAIHNPKGIITNDREY